MWDIEGKIYTFIRQQLEIAYLRTLLNTIRGKRKNMGQVSQQGCGDKAKLRSLLPHPEAPKGGLVFNR